MQKNIVYSVFLFVEDTNTLSFFPSKSGSAQQNQYDLPTSTEPLDSLDKVKSFFRKFLNVVELPTYQFKQFFHFESDPIKFTHADQKSTKEFVGYIVRVRTTKVIKTLHEKRNGFSFLPEVVISGTENFFFTPLIVSAVQKFLEAEEGLNLEYSPSEENELVTSNN
jgi:hypothetical protein